MGARGGDSSLSDEGSSLLRRSTQVLALQILLQARGLVQVPFLTRTLSVEEFGALTLATSVAGAGSLVALLGLNTGFFLNYVRRDAARTRSALTTVLFFGTPMVGLASLIFSLALAAGVGGGWLRGMAPLAGPLGLLMGGVALREIATVVPRARQDIGFHWANSLLGQYGGLLLGLALLVHGMGPGGFLLGLGAGALASALWAMAYSLRRSEGPVGWDGAFGSAVARTGAPVVPMALAQAALLSLDYLYVTRFLGPAALASYGLAYTLASPVMLGVAALNFTLLPEYVSRLRQGEEAFVALVDRLLKWGWVAGLCLVAAAVAFGPLLVAGLAGRPYREAGHLLSAIVSSYLLFTLGQVLHVVRSARLAEVRASAGVTIVCAMVSAGLGLWLIPIYGTRGAAAITLLSFLLYFLGMTKVVRPVLPGRIASLRPGLPLLGIVVGPVVTLLDPSSGTRAVVASLLAAVALGRLAPLRRLLPAGGPPPNHDL